jgi:hypothetical protein
LAALGPVDGLDVRGMPDGSLLHLRDTYPIETAWAPQWVGDELRQVRVGARQARLGGLRAGAEAAAARRHGDHVAAARKQELTASHEPWKRRTGRPRRSSSGPWTATPARGYGLMASISAPGCRPRDPAASIVRRRAAMSRRSLRSP